MAQQTETLARPLRVGARGGWKRTLAPHEGLIIGTISVLAFMIFWEWVGTSGIVNPMFTSSPSRIIKAADKLFFDGGIGAVFGALLVGNLAAAWGAIAKGSIWKDIWVSTQELLAGYILALVVGIVLGLAMGWFRRFNYIMEPFVSALYATPSVALLPLYIIWFGIGINSKIAVIFMSGVFYPLMYARVGVSTVDANILKCAKSFGANDFQLLKTVVLPSSIPYLMTGARLGLGRALVGVVVGELYAATAGVGYLITVAGATFQTDKVFVGVLIITFAGVFLSALLQRVEDRFSTWRPRLNEDTAN
ncbi:MAG TPA: ABC transporter permease [Chloroflexota bacterium]|nr:ABC transporter permease [Chloroflexota bacterium]